MSMKLSFPDTWAIVVAWVLASLIGWVAGLVLGALLIQLVALLPGLDEDRAFTSVVLLAIGAATGVAQSRVLARQLPHPMWWIVLTLIGSALCVLVIAGANWLKLGATTAWGNALLMATLGLAFGLPQWRALPVLRRTVAGAWVWLPAMMISFLPFT